MKSFHSCYIVQTLGNVFPKCVNPLPHMSILGFSTTAANRDMMSKVWTNGNTTRVVTKCHLIPPTAL